jgi:hypothetical protein
MQGKLRRVFVGLSVGAAFAGFAPVASATITPALTLDQSAGTRAGSTVNLGMDLTFSPSSGDSPKDMTLSLPAGLLANASIDGGACLRASAPTAACQVGSGTVTANANEPLGGLVPISGQVAFYLVAPPKPADLAGLALQVTLLGQTSQLGSPGEITVRPAGDPAGVGLNIAFTNIPNTFALPLPALGGVLGSVPIQVRSLDNTLSGIRMPAACPAAPAKINVTADSYSAPSTPVTTSAPLKVTGCSSLPFTPAFHVSAVKDDPHGGVQITTDVTQPASPAQSTSQSVALTLPTSVLTANAEAVLSGGILCASPGSPSCKTIGTASSTSPLYPVPLVGKDYLTGTIVAPKIAIVFPAPFALTLSGSVDVSHNTTTFSNLPDIPLTDLQVKLAGGPDATFLTDCAPASGGASASLTSWGGLRAVVPTQLTVSGCSASSSGPVGSSPRGRLAQIQAAKLSGLTADKPALSFRLGAGKGDPKLRSFSVKLPRGVSFVRHRVHKRLKVTGVSVKGAKIRSIVLRKGRLVITLRRAVAKLSVKVTRQGLKEGAALDRKAKHHELGRMNLTVAVKNAAGKSATLTARLKT